MAIVTERSNVWMQREPREVMEASQNIFEQSSTQLLPLGERLAYRDGRVFHYAQAGAANLAAGKLVGCAVVATQREDTLTAAAAAGATQVTVTAAVTKAADYYNDGFLAVVSGTGLGLQYKIADHAALTAASTATIYLHDQIVTALDTTSDVILYESIFKSVILCPDDVILTLGVPPIPITATYYGWIQTWGPAIVLANQTKGAATTERAIYTDIAAGTDGGFINTAGGYPGTPAIGELLFDSTNTAAAEYWPVFLKCVP